jgi:OPA family sugar phosphate sensor protein UhpC-like MFS transporter
LSAERERNKWRYLVFASTWLAYAGYYLTRKNYAVAQPAFMQELGWTKDQVGIIVTGYATVYAVGQFINGVLGDRLGARVMLAIGFVLTAICSALLGFGESVGVMALIYGINGYAQSMGWPNVTRAMTNWFTVRERGRVMGWWGTNYPVGEAIATAFAAFLLAHYGWRSTFIVPAAVVLVVGVAVTLMVRDHPRDVGLPPINLSTRTAPAVRESAWASSLKHLKDARVLTVGLAYFCLKFVRYTFIFWIGTYFVETMGFTPVQAAELQIPFPLIGALGAIAAGYLSDKVFRARRAPAAVLMLVGLGLGLIVFLFLPKDALLAALVLSFCGFMTFGPDMLISAAAAMDFGTEEAGATATGFVNGLGSAGAAVQGAVVGWVAHAYGWDAVFYILIGMVVACIGVTATLWNARGE